MGVKREMSKTAPGEEEQIKRCFKAATLFLGYRPRSEPELRERLNKKGFTLETIEPVIANLKRLRFVDDAAFAEFWKDNRESFSPRSKALTRQELRQKGVSTEIIEQTLDGMDDDDAAYRAGMRKAGSLAKEDYESFRRKLGGYLQRRGFNYGVIEHALKRVWQEAKPER